MDKVLHDLLNWTDVEEITCSESQNPHRILGAHVTDKGVLVQVYIPTARDISVKWGNSNRLYEMELVDETGFFAVLIPEKKIQEYSLVVFYDNDTLQEIADPYSFEPQYTDEELGKFGAGIHYSAYEKMGAHPETINGVKGVYFSVWAPCAKRVSVVGDFNLWDGRRHQMRKLGTSGVYELFIPGIERGALYKYEIKFQNGDPALKADPYANYAELRPNTASVVWDINQFQWTDEEWLKQRARIEEDALQKGLEKPLSIYEVHLGSWMRKEPTINPMGKQLNGTEFLNYRELAEKLAVYVKEMNFTHVELMPVMEHPYDASWGYQVTGYYAPTSRYGTPDDFMYFINYMHEQGIGVLLDWVPAHFPRDSWGLADFDGSCLYEHKDPRQGIHSLWGTLLYNYGRPEVKNFLIANALFWVEKYHADGIRFDAVASMLYLDFGKKPGEWVANIFGGNENLEAVEFIKHLNSIFKKRKDGTMLIAEESTAWPMVTGGLKNNGLGFDFKWNMGWANDFLGFLKCEPRFRKDRFTDLTFSMIYNYSERFILPFSHDDVTRGKSSLVNKMPGDTLEEKFAELRAAYGYMLGHPGKKLLFMGQEFGQSNEWSEDKSVDWELLEQPVHRQMQDYVKALNKIYRDYPACYEMDDSTEGFQWMNCMDSEHGIVSFVRKNSEPENTLLFVVNFSPDEHEKYRVPVPGAGKYKEIFSSNAAAYGGDGRHNVRVKSSHKEYCAGMPDSMEIYVPKHGVSIFTYTPENMIKGKEESSAAAKAVTKTQTAESSEAKTVIEKTNGKAAVKSADTRVAKAANKARELARAVKKRVTSR